MNHSVLALFFTKRGEHVKAKILYHVPGIGHEVVFSNSERYRIDGVEWILREDETMTKVEITVSRIKL